MIAPAGSYSGLRPNELKYTTTKEKGMHFKGSSDSS